MILLKLKKNVSKFLVQKSYLKAVSLVAHENTICGSLWASVPMSVSRKNLLEDGLVIHVIYNSII